MFDYQRFDTVNQNVVRHLTFCLKQNTKHEDRRLRLAWASLDNGFEHKAAPNTTPQYPAYSHLKNSFF